MGLALRDVIKVDMSIAGSSIKTTSSGLSIGFAVFSSTFNKICANSMLIDFKISTEDLQHKMKEYIISEEWRLDDNVVDAKRSADEARDTFERRDEAFSDFANMLISPGDLERAREAMKQKEKEQWFAEYWASEYRAKADKVSANLGIMLTTSQKTSKGFLNEYKTGVHNISLDDENIQDQQIIDAVELAWEELGDSSMLRLRNRVANNFERIWSSGEGI